MFEKEMTVGQLKEFLSKYADETKVLAITDNYEMGNNMVDARISEIKCTKKTESFRDDFDGTRYSTKVYNYDDAGEAMIIIRG